MQDSIKNYVVLVKDEAIGALAQCPDFPRWSYWSNTKSCDPNLEQKATLALQKHVEDLLSFTGNKKRELPTPTPFGKIKIDKYDFDIAITATVVIPHGKTKFGLAISTTL